MEAGAYFDAIRAGNVDRLERLVREQPDLLAALDRPDYAPQRDTRPTGLHVAVYAEEPAGSTRDMARAALESETRAALAALPLETRDAATLAERARLNDACLALVATYTADVPRYAQRLDAMDGDLAGFVARLRAVADEEDPRSALPTSQIRQRLPGVGESRARRGVLAHQAMELALSLGQLRSPAGNLAFWPGHPTFGQPVVGTAVMVKSLLIGIDGLGAFAGPAGVAHCLGPILPQLKVSGQSLDLVGIQPLQGCGHPAVIPLAAHRAYVGVYHLVNGVVGKAISRPAVHFHQQAALG